LIIHVALKPAKGNRRTYFERDDGIAFIKQFPGQHGRSQASVKEPGGMEKGPIAPLEKDRQNRCLCVTYDCPHHRIPRGIGDLPLRDFHVGDFPRREYQEHAAFLHPANGLPNGPYVGPGRMSASERIDRYDELSQLGYAIEHKIGHNFHVSSHRQKEVSKHETFDAAERMICHNNNRAFFGDEVTFLTIEFRAHIQMGEHTSHEKMGIGLLG
jgi:hypothetical protein